MRYCTLEGTGKQGRRWNMKALARVATLVLATVLTWCVIEGARALLRGGSPGRSLAWELSDGFRSPDPTSPWDGYPVIHSRRQFDDLMEAFARDGVAFGNTPFDELRNDAVAFNIEGEYLRQKPDLDRTFAFLRCTLFEAFNPPAAFHDTDARLGDDVARFLDTYAIRRTRHRTNGHGERLTLPVVEADDVVLIAGDSVANGAGVDDAETVASQLQRRDGTRRYVNIGVGGAEAFDIAGNIDAALERYAGRVRELVYIYCENDFKDDKPLGRPDAVIRNLERVASTAGIDRVAVVYAPYIFNVFPDVTRVPGDRRAWKSESHRDERAALVAATDRAHFDWIDIGELARGRAQESGSMYGGLCYFVDVVHLSGTGAAAVAAALRRTP